LKDQLRLLKELQTIDSQARELRKQMTDLPEKLGPARKDLAKLEALLNQARTDLASHERWKADQEDLVKREEEAVRQARAKLQASRNTRDYGAANREVENKRRSVAEREEELGRVRSAMETSRNAISTNETEVARLQAELATEESTVAARVAELEIEVRKFDAERKALTDQLPADLLKRYDTVQKRRGIALAPVANGICQGCHMSLPPQLNNIIARLSSIETCPSCNRLLYRPELFADAPQVREGNGEG
jgi:predicted  nucleic acid-binding Zn-ribbon protein